jgi:hypothetical protein
MFLLFAGHMIADGVPVEKVARLTELDMTTVQKIAAEVTAEGQLFQTLQYVSIHI